MTNIDTTAMEQQIAEIVAADSRAKAKTRADACYKAQARGLWTLIGGVSVVAAMVLVSYLALVEVWAGERAARMHSPDSDKQVGFITVARDICGDLRIPYYGKRVLAAYVRQRGDLVESEMDTIRKDLAGNAILFGMMKFIACPLIQAKIDMLANQR